MKLAVATGNSHKLAEFKRILKPLGFEAISASELGVVFDVEETGETFLENSVLKARALFELTGLPSIADDSGLCVDALDGRPGVYSSRYGGENLSSAGQIKLLLKELENVPDKNRTARFISAICCVFGADDIVTCEGVCEGRIGHKPLGENGFGYDPVFMVGDKSFSQLVDEEKDAVSHRGVALREFVKLLEKRIN